MVMTHSMGRTTGARALRPKRNGMVAGLIVCMIVAIGCGSSDGGLSVEFSGDACDYSGPAELGVGEAFEMAAVDVTEDRADVGFAVLKVVDGVSAEEAEELGVAAVAVDRDPAALLYSAVTEPDTERSMTGALDAAGTWLVNCFVIDNADGEDFPAATIEAVASS